MALLDVNVGDGLSLPGVPDVPSSLISDWKLETDRSVSVLVGRAEGTAAALRQTVLSAAGEFNDAIHGGISSLGKKVDVSGLDASFAAISAIVSSRSFSVGGALSALASGIAAASPIAGAAIGLFGSMFGAGSPPPTPPPSVDGIEASDLKNDPLSTDRRALVTGHLMSGQAVEAAHGLDAAAIRAALSDKVSGWLQDLVWKHGYAKLQDDPAKHRGMAIALSQLSPRQLARFLAKESRGLSIAVQLATYGAPRAALQQALGYYGLLLNAEAAQVSASIFHGGASGDGSERRPYASCETGCERSMVFPGPGAWFKGCYTATKARTMYSSGTAEKTLCGQITDWRDLLSILLLPAWKYSNASNRNEAFYTIPPDVIASEKRYFASLSEPVEVYTHAQGHAWTFRFSGRHEHHLVALPEAHEAVTAAIRAALSNTDKVDRIRRQMADAAAFNAGIISEAKASPSGRVAIRKSGDPRFKHAVSLTGRGMIVVPARVASTMETAAKPPPRALRAPLALVGASALAVGVGIAAARFARSQT